MTPFLIVAIAILTMVGSLIGFRLLLPLRMSIGWTASLWIATQVCLYLPLATLVIRRSGLKLPPVLIHLTWLATGAISITLFLLLLRDLGLLLLQATRLIGQISGHDLDSLADAGRRAFLSRSAGISLLVVSGGLTVSGLRRAYSMTRLVELDLPVEHLHPDLDGLRLVQISDLHIGVSVGKKHVQAVVDRVNSLEPDFILFTGDLADGTYADLAESAAPLAELKSRLGTFAVTGNHEYYADPAGWLNAIPQLGFQLLVNKHREIKIGNAVLRVGGVPDISASRIIPAHTHRPELALPADGRADFNLLLAHQPKSAFAAEQSACDLMLSGHTHGGQYHPFTYAADKLNPYLKGLNRHKNFWVYVSSGTGFWGPPIRLGTAAEITVIRLRTANEG